MPIKFVTPEEEYGKDKDLKKEDVTALKEWVKKQGHLPDVSEIKLILFLQSCYYRSELAKTAIENYYTVKTHCPEIFKNRDLKRLKQTLDTWLITPLPQLTDKNYKIMYCRMMDIDPDRFSFSETVALFDMTANLTFAQIGTTEGQILVLDAAGAALGHILKVNINLAKKVVFYLQEGYHVRLMAVHIINTLPIIETVLNMFKSFIKQDILDVIHLHSTMDSFYKHVPQELMPSEYGGKGGTFKELQDAAVQNLRDNEEFTREEEAFVVDESRRVEKSKFLKEMGDVGVEGTFKKLDID